jgi:hypothetical protein
MDKAQKPRDSKNPCIVSDVFPDACSLSIYILRYFMEWSQSALYQPAP